jgi:hypothetical protein
MDIWRQKTSVVSKLRIRGKGFDALAARLQFERLFGADDFLPGSLPPKAIVCIKNLRDPLPRTLRLNRSDIDRSDTWRNSVAREIERLYGRAFRPVRETVPALAESVVFADNSELLACLASDWCEGLLTQRWWWRSLFPDPRLAQMVAKVWIEAAEFVPAALQLLSKQGKAVKFATKLQPNETVNLLGQMIRVFNLDKLQAALFEMFDEKKEFAVSSLEDRAAKRSLPAEAYVPSAFRTSAPWFRLAAETQHPALNFEQQCLLGIGLTLAHSPGTARSTEFARKAKIFRSEFETAATSAGKDKILKQARKSGKQKKKIEEFSFLRETPEVQPVSPETAVKPEKSFEDSLSSGKKPSKSRGAWSESEPEGAPAVGTAKKKSGKIIFEAKPEKKFERRKSEKETKLYQVEKREPDKIVYAGIAEETETGLGVETKFGGVVYLLNLALYLKLYRDFTESAETEIDLDIWDFVALFGLEFLGRKIKADPVWKLLKRLAGRESEKELGQGFAPADEWRMPREWLKTFQTEEKWLWINTGKRLVVRHPAGFRVIDVLLHRNVKGALERELKIYGRDLSGLTRSGTKDFRKYLSPRKNWLKILAEYMRARLFQALNLETQEQINAILFERKATINVTATHLDVTFSLADIAFEVRSSGLDRNPSWIPAAGKFINFHFI